MPCYEREPEWSAAAYQDGKNAAAILCALVKGAPSYLMVPPPILAWYRGHLDVDLAKLDDPRGRLPLPVDRDALIREMAAVDVALGAQQ